jgi:spermidine synthase
MLNKNENRIKFSVFVVGLTTIVTQIVLLRNFLSVFSGNELIIGVVFSNWMLITAIGAYFSKFIRFKEFNVRLIFFSHLLLGILPIVIAFLIIFLRNVIFPPGKLINIMQIYMGSFLLLLPFCLISGFLFIMFSSFFSAQQKSNQIYKVYGIEAIGAIVGGFFFNFVLIFLFDTFDTLKLLLILNVATALFLYFVTSQGKMPWLIGIGAIVITGFLISTDLSKIAYEQLFKNQSIIELVETPYGNLAVTESSNQINFYESGILHFSSDNVIANEENVHYAMLQHSDPENILLISGGVSGTIDEVLKYNISSVDYVEIDPVLIKLAEKYLRPSKSDKKVNIVNQDARLFLKKSDKKYDVVLINLPNPINTQINRYFTLDFFEEIKTKLSYSGIISISLSGSANYMSKESIQLHTAIYSTMKLVFNNVIIIPGQRNYFIAAETPVSAKIAELSKRNSIANTYVNQYFLDDILISERKNKIEQEISSDAIINYDFYPATYFFQMKLWLSKFKFYNIIYIVVALCIIFILTRLHIINFGLFTTGFSATSLEFILIIAFQVIYGYVYFMLGIFITIFMLGLVIGSIYLFKRIKISYRNYSFIQYLLGIIGIVTPIILVNINSGNPGSFIVHSVFIVLMIVIGIITGLQFSIGTNLRFASIEKTASGSYGADSLGSAFGALIVTAFLIPLFGLIKVCLIIGILNFITGLLILIRTRNK